MLVYVSGDGCPGNAKAGEEGTWTQKNSHDCFKFFKFTLKLSPDWLANSDELIAASQTAHS